VACTDDLPEVDLPGLRLDVPERDELIEQLGGLEGPTDAHKDVEDSALKFSGACGHRK
jgi:hypothetical protein